MTRILASELKAGNYAYLRGSWRTVKSVEILPDEPRGRTVKTVLVADLKNEIPEHIHYLLPETEIIVA